MALPITENLKVSIARATPVYKLAVELYKRSWTGSAYIYDSAVDITEYLTDDSEKRIMWKLDNEDYGVFNLDNTTLEFRNERNQWKQDNPKGLFPSGKLLNQSKIKIKTGAQLADGAYETAYTFTGYVSGDPSFNPKAKTAAITLMSAMSIFEKFNAEEISTLVTDELLGENSGTVFTTDYDGVGIIVIVKRGTTLGNATEIKLGVGYTASDLNKKILPLKITLESALTAGEKLYCSYRYWFQNLTLEAVVLKVMALCGITSYSITPAIFESSIQNTKTYNSEADFLTGSLQNINTTIPSGSIRQKWHKIDDFADGDFTTNLLWTVVSGTWSAASGYLRSISGDGRIDCYRVTGIGSSGTWRFNAEPVQGATLDVHFIRTVGYSYAHGGYFLKIYQYPGENKIQLYKYGDVAGPTLLAEIDVTLLYSDIVTINRNSDGLFSVYKNAALLFQATDTLYSGTFRGLTATAYPGAGYIKFGNFWYSHAILSGSVDIENTIPIWTSPVVDTGADLSSWGQIQSIHTLNGGSITIKTYSSSTSDFSSGNDPAGWIALSETGGILSAILRYIKVQIIFNHDEFAVDQYPVLDEMVVYYYTSTTVIDLVNLTSMKCKQLLELLAKFPAYEIGFNAADRFIYRPRFTTVPPVLDLTSDTNIKAVHSLSDGIERVYNRVTADFGIYKKVADATGDTEPNSVTKYGTREYAVSSSQLLPAENVNIAYAIAPTILAYTKTPRRRCSIETKFILHLELGDLVIVFFREDTALRQWKWGDIDVIYGQADLEYYDEAVLTARLNLWNIIMRVEGVEFDAKNWLTTFNLVEVLA